MSDQGYPNLNPGRVNEAVNGALNSAKATATQAADAITNSQAYQTVANGPVAETASKELNATKSEFSNLAAARQTPSSKAATGQNLTHYHSMFYSLLSWENPRATAISYIVVATSIIVARYVPIDRYVLKALFTVLGITTAAELVGHVVLGEGFATKVRPRQYYTIPRETLESVLGDVEQLINFFVIEFQRILFAENVFATLTAFFAAVLSYFLVKVTPYWGLALIGVTAIYFLPLIYVSNKELIDTQLNNASSVISEQATQVRDLAAQQANQAYEATSSATSQYVNKAQEMMGSAKKTAVDKGYVSKETANAAPGVPVEKVGNTSITTPSTTSTTAPSVPAADKINTASFPTAPKTEPILAEPSSQPVIQTPAVAPAPAL
ncbi:hypothetical protein AMS68_003177 [Peltaster fructicola]|uniref:Reticulon-like protein n=1 Tax=Peltaster fructicola TaxID=286661 RepID=A0A6H0XT73_9PEZI|nr:hypothetical protein AMS68_003177 [Peltaster fructicola]